VIADLDTLLTALYVELTDRIIPSLGLARSGPGKPPEVTDAELACLAVAQVLLRYDDERHWLHAAAGRVGHLFPRLLRQSEYNQRLKNAAPLMEAALRWLADQTPATAEMLRLMDATPIPCGQSVITARRSDLYGWAGYGYCPSHSRWYWGSKLLLIVTCDGTVTGFGLGRCGHIECRRPGTRQPGTTARRRRLRPRRPKRLRAPGGCLRPTPTGNRLRAAARILSAAAIVTGDPLIAQLRLILQLAALTEAVTGLRTAQWHAAQAGAARAAAERLHAARRSYMSPPGGRATARAQGNQAARDFPISIQQVLAEASAKAYPPEPAAASRPSPARHPLGSAAPPGRPSCRDHFRATHCGHAPVPRINDTA
jgi:hypothetical protein